MVDVRAGTARREQAVGDGNGPRPSDPDNAAWRGSVGPGGGDRGRGLRRSSAGPADCVAYVCGNPEMTRAVGAILREREFGPHQVRTEEYWPLLH